MKTLTTTVCAAWFLACQSAEVNAQQPALRRRLEDFFKFSGEAAGFGGAAGRFSTTDRFGEGGPIKKTRFPTSAPTLPPLPVDGGTVADYELSDKPATESASYRVIFENTWTEDDHPADYPGDDAHWSPPFIVSHSPEVGVWSEGEVASEGMKNLAETGSLLELIRSLTDEGRLVKDARFGEVMFNSEFEIQDIYDFQLDSDTTYISAASMIAPSPDWFAGFYDFEPIVDGMWLKRIVIDSQPFSAGTDGGDTYTSADDPLSPPGTIFELTPDTVPGSGVFVKDGAVAPVARWILELDTSPDDSGGGGDGPLVGGDETSAQPLLDFEGAGGDPVLPPL